MAEGRISANILFNEIRLFPYFYRNFTFKKLCLCILILITTE
jgi:hypothetical protein